MLRRLVPVLVAFSVVACGSAPREDIGTGAAPLTTVCGASASDAVQGRDVSVYQGNFDWNAQKAAGVVFGFARIGDGTGTVDNTFAGNWSKMKAAGVMRGAYQFFEPGEDATAQANLMVQAVGQLGEGDLPCMIDVESTGGQSGGTIASKVQTWLTIVEQGTGKTPFIYTGPYFWQDNVGSASFGKYPLWIADYGPSCPLIPNGWSNWTIWQYGDGNGTLDHDVFNGSLADLQKLAGSSGPTYPMIAHRGAVDINGDGKADICARAAAGIVCEVSSGAATSEVQGPAWSDASGWDKPEYYTTIQLADVDGDGKGDLCARDAQGIVCEISDGDGFGAEIRGPAWSDANGWNKPEYYATIQFADVNGDGKADVCGRAAAGVICNLSDGSGFPTEITGPGWSDAGNWLAPQYYSTIQFVDVNGDGKADVCGRAAAGVLCQLSDGNGFPTAVKGPAWSDASGWAAPQYESTIRFADINADGYLDVCGRAAAGIVCELGDGNAFPTEVQGPAWSDANGWAAAPYFTTIQFADINGDGKADLCGRAAIGILCELSDGNGFPTEIAGPTWSTQGGWDAPEFDSTIGFADLDNDGKDDVCARGWAGLQCALSTGAAFADPQPGPTWSDPSGWGVEKYYGSIRYAGAKHASPTPPHPSGDGGTTKPGSDGGSSNREHGSGGCAVSRGPAQSGWSIATGIIFALVRLRRRR